MARIIFGMQSILVITLQTRMLVILATSLNIHIKFTIWIKVLPLLH